MPPQPDLWTHTSCLPSPPPMREFYFLNHSQIFKRVYIPIRGSQSQLSKVSRQLKFSHIIWHMYQKPSLPPRNHTNLDPAIPHGRMSPRAIIKQVGLKKKKRPLKDVHCHTVYTGKAEPPSCPTTED